MKLWAQPSVLYNGYRVIPGVKRPRRWPPIPSSAEVKERVELYLYSLSGPSLPVPGWTLLLWDEEKVLANTFQTTVQSPYNETQGTEFFCFPGRFLLRQVLDSRDCLNWRRYSSKDRDSLSPRAVKDCFRCMFSFSSFLLSLGLYFPVISFLSYS